MPADDSRLRQDFIPLLPESTPAVTASYRRELPRVVLPDPAVPATGSATTPTASAAGSAAPRRVEVAELAAILMLSAGLKTGRGAGAHPPFRAAGSAGNRHPYEVYVSARDVAGLPDGVWRYEPGVPGALVRVGPPAASGRTAVVITGVPWRTCWRYAERGYRHMAWDCGTVASHVVAVAAAHGLPALVLTAFEDAVVARLVGATSDAEVPMCVVSLGGHGPALGPGGAAEPAVADPTAESFALVRELHAASTLTGPEAVAAWRRGRPAGPPRAVPDAPRSLTRLTVADVVQRRASARRLDPEAVVPVDLARHVTALAAATVPWDAGDLLGVRVVVHAVADVEPGVHIVRQDDLLRMAPATRDRTFRAALSQEQARDAALVIGLVPAPGPGVAPDPRTYRASLIGAGFVLGRICLEAAGLGLGCTALTVVDSLVPEALGAEQALALVAIGGRR